jgi:hypothetical protein
MSVALHEVEPVRHADCALDVIRKERAEWQREHRRPAALTAREALAAVRFECLLVWSYGKFVLAGNTPTHEDETRVNTALANIDEICDEVGV